MSGPDTAERELVDDLATLGERFADEEFCTDLYRALAGGHLTKDGAAVAPSWNRAEQIVDELRSQQGAERLALAQTGGEGEASALVSGELDRLGWRWRPRDTSRHDSAHVGSPESPPPEGTGEARAPVSDSHAWEREGHAEADRARRDPREPPQAGPGEGAGGGEAPRVGGS